MIILVKLSDILSEAFSFTVFRTSGYTSECFTGGLALTTYLPYQTFGPLITGSSHEDIFICFSIVLNDCTVCSAKPLEAR